jgi:hypothetical protein
MQQIHFPTVLGLVLVAGLSFAPVAHAQLPWRWFGPRAMEKAIPDSRRIAEVNVEIAWLADPVTCPYYLEARVTDTRLEMRGYVPNKAVRDHALRIAQVYSSLPVTDALKEHPSLLVRPSTMSPQQLQTSAQSSLRVALPKQYQQFKIECGTDGKVFVAGPVNTYDEKIAVSHALRRLHGCTSVQNLTTLPAALAQNPPTMLPKAPIIKTSNSSEQPLAVAPESPVPAKSRWLFWPFKKATVIKDEPPLIEAPRPSDADGPIMIPNRVDRESPAAPPSPAALQRRILAACKQAKGVEVQFTSATAVRITAEVRTEKDIRPAAESILALPELRDYRPELLFKVSAQ